MPSELLRIIDEYIGPDPPTESVYVKYRRHRSWVSRDLGLVDGCSLFATHADLHPQVAGPLGLVPPTARGGRRASIRNIA